MDEDRNTTSFDNKTDQNETHVLLEATQKIKAGEIKCLGRLESRKEVK